MQALRRACVLVNPRALFKSTPGLVPGRLVELPALWMILSNPQFNEEKLILRICTCIYIYVWLLLSVNICRYMYLYWMHVQALLTFIPPTDRSRRKMAKAPPFQTRQKEGRKGPLNKSLGESPADAQETDAHSSCAAPAGKVDSEGLKR